MRTRPVRPILLALAMLAFAGGAAQAQLFGQPRNEDSEIVARMGRLENQIRQLTGMVEELQHRNGQLEQQLQRVQQDTDFRFQEMSPPGRGGARAPSAPARQQQPAIPPGPRGQSDGVPQQPALPPVASRPEPAPPAQGRRDVFDPTMAPDAPGVPRPLGTIPGGPAAPDQGGRGPGTPLDLGSLQGSGGPAQASQPLPPSMGGAPVGQQAVLAPSGSPRDEYDLAYGAVLRRDYSLAVDGFRTFLANHSASRQPDAQRLVPEAHYWLGESQYQMKQYNDSAETFLKISTEFPNAVKAPEALLRLGQSLVELGERETACASLGHVLTKYPKASANVKRAVEQEQKRARC